MHKLISQPQKEKRPYMILQPFSYCRNHIGVLVISNEIALSDGQKMNWEEGKLQMAYPTIKYFIIWGCQKSTFEALFLQASATISWHICCLVSTTKASTILSLVYLLLLGSFSLPTSSSALHFSTLILYQGTRIVRWMKWKEKICFMELNLRHSKVHWTIRI